MQLGSLNSLFELKIRSQISTVQTLYIHLGEESRSIYTSVACFLSPHYWEKVKKASIVFTRGFWQLLGETYELLQLCWLQCGRKFQSCTFCVQLATRSLFILLCCSAAEISKKFQKFHPTVITKRLKSYHHKFIMQAISKHNPGRCQVACLCTLRSSQKATCTYDGRKGDLSVSFVSWEHILSSVGTTDHFTQTQFRYISWLFFSILRLSVPLPESSPPVMLWSLTANCRRSHVRSRAKVPLLVGIVGP